RIGADPRFRLAADSPADLSGDLTEPAPINNDAPNGAVEHSPLVAGPAASPGISVTRTPEGLVAASDDPEALDRFMELVDRIRPNNLRDQVFQLKHTYASDVVYL